MITISLNFAGVPNTNPYLATTGFTSVGAANAEVFSSEWAGTNSSLNSLWRCDTLPNVDQFSLYITSGGVSTNSRGFAFFNSSGNGFMFIARNTDVRVFALAAYALSASALATYAITLAVDDVIRCDVTQSTGNYVVKRNGTTLGTFVNTTYTSGLYGGILSRQGGIKAFSLEYTSPYAVTSINGGSPITAGQTGIAIVATGFTAKPTGVTATYASGTKSITATMDSGGTATNFNISIQDRIEGEDWPLNDSDISYTFTYGAESASLTQKLVKKATETVLTFAAAIISDPTMLGYWLAADGFTVDGGGLAYIPYSDLVLTADSGGSATTAGTFTSWFRPSTGTGAGNVYAYTWVVTEAGISPDSGGLTTRSITCSKVNATKLTARRI